MTRKIVLFVVLALCAFVSPSAVAVPPESGIMPLSEVEKGMTGYGLTVFDGADVERFDVEILGVLENIGPDRSLILARIDSEVIRRSGVIAGMSGSPVYIDGRMIGALAYSWTFSKEPIAGITPIEDVLGIERHARASSSGSIVKTSAGDVFEALAKSDIEAMTSIFEEIVPQRSAVAGGAMPIMVPLSLSMFENETISRFTPYLEAANFLPVPTGSPGSGATDSDSRASLAPGDAFSAVLVDGDFSLAATGTVTHVQGSDLYGFGHPFLHMGSIDFPLAEAEVVAILPSLASSFKLSNKGRIVGALTQDRQSGVYGKIGQSVDMVPLRFSLESESGTKEYSLRAVEHPALFPLILAMTADSVVTIGQRGNGDRTVMMDAEIRVEGREPIRLTQGWAGADARQAIPMYLSIVSGYLISNQFDEAKVESIDVRFHHQDEPKIARLTKASVDTPADGKIQPGDTLTVRAQLEPYRGEPFEKTLTLELPENIGEGPLYVFVGSGSALTVLDFMLVPPSPRNFAQVIEVIERLRPSSDLVAGAYIPGEGVISGGVYLPELPPTMHLVTVEEKGEVGSASVKYHPVRHVADGTDQVITGAHRIDLEIEPVS